MFLGKDLAGMSPRDYSQFRSYPRISRYGDKTPKSMLARAYSVVWMLVGIVTISIVTAEITSTLTTTELQGEQINKVSCTGILRKALLTFSSIFFFFFLLLHLLLPLLLLPFLLLVFIINILFDSSCFFPPSRPPPHQSHQYCDYPHYYYYCY